MAYLETVHYRLLQAKRAAEQCRARAMSRLSWCMNTEYRARTMGQAIESAARDAGYAAVIQRTLTDLIAGTGGNSQGEPG